ncbi:hypothetical protein SORBI_3001G495550 [Sorghum bicolor]|uniref:Uncharacterized protein n=1 Tax=Sorghum bicolor TaxID=4558 RepID=A0A1Z5SBQ6_SORBI|nr:hypothetical protein SORBI_3001G495550 [Sorghum bicolor]
MMAFPRPCLHTDPSGTRGYMHPSLQSLHARAATAATPAGTDTSQSHSPSKCVLPPLPLRTSTPAVTVGVTTPRRAGGPCCAVHMHLLTEECPTPSCLPPTRTGHY